MYPPNLSMRDALVVVIGGGFACHLIFNRLEPRNMLVFAFLLVIAPMAMAPLLYPFLTSAVLATIATWAIYVTTLMASTVIYRLSPFHPLARYPGPVMCKISKIWFAGVSMGGKQHIYYQTLHHRYGDVVRIGPNELSFCNPSAIAPMMGPGGMPKAAFWDGQFATQKKWRSLIGLRDPQVHASLRRIWSRGFTADAIKYYQGLIDRRATQLLDSLEQKAGLRVDLSQWISWFAYDFMNDMAFGDGPEVMRDQDAGGLWHLMENAQPTGLFMSHLPWTAVLYKWIPVAKKMKHFRDYSYQRAAKRYKDGSPNKDLFYHLIDEGGLEASPPAFAQVVNDASLAIVAGSDTISPALSNLFWLLLCNPAAYTRLQDELDKAGDSISDTATQARLPYLNAAINETMRLFPPALSGSTRAPLVGGGGHTIGTHYIPEGTTANVHTYTLQRDGRNFSPLPERYLPERWLPAEQQITLEPDLFKNRDLVIHNTAAFIPFSYGPMDCIGKKLAMQEMRMVACGVLQRFEIRFEPGFDEGSWEAGMLDYFVTRKARLPVILTLRSEK